MTSPFSQPAAPSNGDKFEPKAYFNKQANTGALCLVYVDKVNEARQWNPSFPACETVSADIVVLDVAGPDGQPLVLRDTMVFGQLMVAQLRANLRDGNSMVLGRITQVPSKFGEDKPAWKFGDFTPGVDDVRAQQYIASHPRNTFGQPGGTPPAAQAPVQQWQPPAPQAAPQPWTHPAAATPPPVAALDPNLVAYLVGHGIKPEFIATLDDNAARNLAATFGS